MLFGCILVGTVLTTKQLGIASYITADNPSVFCALRLCSSVMDEARG